MMRSTASMTSREAMRSELRRLQHELSEAQHAAQAASAERDRAIASAREAWTLVKLLRGMAHVIREE